MKNLLIKNYLVLRTTSFLILLSISFSILPLAAKGQTTEPPASRQLVMKEKTLGEAPRLALIIGNSKYQNVTKLNNASADAVDMAAVLRSLNFEVIEGEDQSLRQMVDLVQDFGDKLLRQKGIGLFFYAGHGVQSGGKNYLIPVDADIPSEDAIEWTALDIGRVLKKFAVAKNDLNIIVLDACRNNPFAKDWSSYRDITDDGLAKIMSPPKGTFLFYSTEPGKTASDGEGRNGLFTEALLANIKTPNMELDRLYKVVSESVKKKSKEKQTPYREGNITNDFYFAGNSAGANPILPSPVVKINETEPEIKVTDAATVEKESWDLIKNSNNPQDFRGFLVDSPTGIYSVKAKIKLEQLTWDSIKATNDKVKIQSYLNEFSDGANVRTAKVKLRQLEARENNETATSEPVSETVKAEIKEPVETPVKEEIPVKKVSVPKVSSRTASAKTKPSVSGASKFQTKTNKFEMDLVYLPAGSFMMGASEANVNESYSIARKEDAEIERSIFDNEKPQHRVAFAEGFWIGKTEVTQAQWTSVMGENPSRYSDCADCPVERINWEDAKKFVEKLNAQKDGFEYRLPSEAEWEYAARGGKTGVLPATSARMTDFAWHNVNSGDGGLSTKPHPVGTLQPNAFGLFDMHGNVAEWCEDTYVENYENSNADGTANMTGDPKTRILRGGFFNDLPYRLRWTRRNKLTTDIRRSENGLRIVAVEKE